MRQIILLLFVALSPILSLPVIKATMEPAEETGDLEDILEYERYLKEVVEALETDPEFRQKLNNGLEDNIRNIVNEVKYVTNQATTRLDVRLL